MAKTCRTCRAASMMLECALGWPCSGACERHAERETPLLVDRLAKMVRLLMSPVGEAFFERAEAVDAAKALLEDYQKEVVDAKA